MNEMNLVENINNSFDLVKNLEIEENSIVFAINNSKLNKFYFNAGKRDYFISVHNKLKDVESKLIQNQNLIDPIVYENIMKSLNKFINSIEISIKSIDNIIDDYSNYREVDFTNLRNSFYQNKINSDVYLNDIKNIDLLKLVNNYSNKKKEENNQEPKYEEIKDDNINYETIPENNEYQEINNNEEEYQKLEPERSVEELMGQIQYNSLENYNQKLMEFRTKHEIDLIDKQIMVLENSAKIKDLITLEQLKTKKVSLEQYLDKYNNKKSGIIVSRENLIKKNDEVINDLSESVNTLNSNKYESKLFNSVNNLKIFVTSAYINKLNKSKQNLIINQRQAVINKFNGRYAKISKLAMVKGTVVGTIDKLKMLKNQVISEANNIVNDLNHTNENSIKYSI